MLSVFIGLVALVGVTRLVELGISRRHRAALMQHGARTVSEPAFAAMVAVHIGMLAFSVLEALWFRSQPPLWLSALAVTGLVLASSLRVWAIRSLGQHWNVRVIDSTALGVVTTGPYRFIRHPNYVAVFVELACLPLVYGAWVTALLGSALHLVVLARRLRIEEAVLASDCAYQLTMGDKPRFVPRLTRSVGNAAQAGRL